MIKTTTIIETHQTAAGSVEAEIRVTVSGDPDGVAKVDRTMLKHIQELRPAEIASPIERQITNGCIEFYAPSLDYYDRIQNAIELSRRVQLHAGGYR
jgi:hypothetical protein